MRQKYYSLRELVNMIDEPNQSCCKHFLDDNEDKIKNAKGSKTKHQFWNGGYIGHLTETMNIAITIFNSLNSNRKLGFSLQDVLLVLFLHDLEKPWKYSNNDSDVQLCKSFSSSEKFKKSIIEKFNFELTEELWKGLKHVHGEINDYDSHIKIQSPLSAFAHICDNISARIWFDFPNDSDEWSKNHFS